MPDNNGNFTGVSICLTTYNSAQYIERTLQSILDQSYSDFRVILSDDASTDDTVELCEKYAVIDPRIKIYRNAQRLGWVNNVNRCLQYADGRFLMNMAHDDVLYPRYLTSLIAVLESNPSAIGAFSDVERHKLNGTKKLLTYEALEGMASPEKRGAAVVKGNQLWWLCYRGVIRMSAYKKIGGLRTHIRGEFSADWPWVLKLALAGELVRVPEPLYGKIRRRGSLSETWRFNMRDWLAVQYDCIKTVSESDLSFRRALPIYAALLRKVSATAVSAPVRMLIRH